MKTKAFNLSRAMTGDGMVVSFYTKDIKAVEDFFSSLPDEVQVEMGRQKKKRSLDANAYMWVLLDKLAAKLNSTAEEIYRELVRRVGVFDWILVTKEACNDFMLTWALKGTGWIAERVQEKEKGIVLKVYKGSSAYTVEEMQRLITEVQEECKAQGIETATPDELAELMERWKSNE